MRERNDVSIKVEEKLGGYQVLTSRNGNGWWAVGIPFTTPDAALRIAVAIQTEAQNQGDDTTLIRVG